MNNPSEQAGLLTECSSVILRAQPVLALQMLRLALLLAPRENSSLRYAKEIFKRRGRWAAEQTVSEILTTATQATAVSPSLVGLIESEPETTQPNFTQTMASSPNEMISENSVEIDFEEKEVQVNLNHEEPLQAAVDVEEQPVAQQAMDAGSRNLFEEYISRCGFDPEWLKFSNGFSQNTSGLVAYVNLLMTMQLVSENRKTEALLTLLKIINEFRDDSGGDQLFDRLFMQRSQRGEA